MSAIARKIRFIPYRRQDIVDMCIRENNPGVDVDDFRQLGHMLDQVFHFEFHQVVEALKNTYADSDPDTDTRRPEFLDSRVDGSFVELLDGLLEKANYERVTQADLNRALSESSLFKISLHVDFDDFSEVSLFARGESVRNETVSSWFGLRKTTIEFVNYERVVVYLRIRDNFEHTKHDFASCRAGAAALGGYLWKQFSNFKNRKLRFMETLTRNLYFKNLDNNAGVFHRLVNDAEEEESKEAILAYYFLLTSEAALSKAELDQKIEQWFDSSWNCSIDFEIDDALRKLLALGLVETSAGRLGAVSISEGIRILDQRWDNYFVT